MSFLICRLAENEGELSSIKDGVVQKSTPACRVSGWVVKHEARSKLRHYKDLRQQTWSTSFRAKTLEGAQEIDDFLLLLHTQLIEVFDDLIGLAALAFVSADGFDQIGCASIMKEEDALPRAPERSGAELVGAGAALRDAVGEALAHVVDDEIGPEVRRLVRKGGAWDCRGAAGNHFARG